MASTKRPASPKRPSNPLPPPRHREPAHQEPVTGQEQRTLVGLWADLLSALQQGSPSISVSAEEMAVDVPGDLITPVNRALRERGCSFRIKRLSSGAAPRPACSPAPAADADVPRRCG